VNDLNRPYIWLPGQKPFYVLDASKLTIKCEESNKMYAHKVVENVPHFKELVTLTNGLVTALTPEEQQQAAEEEPLPHETAGPAVPSVPHATDGDAPTHADSSVAHATDDEATSSRMERLQSEALDIKHWYNSFQRTRCVTPANEPACTQCGGTKPRNYPKWLIRVTSTCSDNVLQRITSSLPTLQVTMTRFVQLVYVRFYAYATLSVVPLLLIQHPAKART
jgi:hypothetical protein